MRTLVLSVLLVILAGTGYAADKKISELTSGSPLQAADMIPIARAGVNFRLAGSDFLSPLLPDGSASAPSVAFASSPTTGFYLAKAGSDLSVSNEFGNTLDGSGLIIKPPTCEWAEVGCAGLTLAAPVSFTGAHTYDITTGLATIFNVTGDVPNGQWGYLFGSNTYVSSTATETGSGAGMISGNRTIIKLESGSVHTNVYGNEILLSVLGNSGQSQAYYGQNSIATGTSQTLAYGAYLELELGDSTTISTEAAVLRLSGTTDSTDGTDASKLFKLRADRYGRSLIEQPRDTDYALELTGGQGISVSGKTNQIQLSTAAGGAKPACASGTRGSLWYEAGGVGAADTVEVCRKDASNNYAWVSVI